MGESAKDLIDTIPSLLLFVVPGYISIHIREKYCLEKKNENFDTLLYSILYSFIIGIVYSLLDVLSPHIFPRIASFLNNSIDLENTVKRLIYLLLAVILGFFLVKIPKTKIGRLGNNLFNKNLSPESSVWLKAMENSNGAWATVYLENGLIYTGMLINYTSDSNEVEKEIILSNYRLSVRNENDSKATDFCTVIVDNTQNSDSKVFLSRNVIVAIEIQK